MINVQVTDKNAIYVDDTRITNRSTKWGIHTSVDNFDCKKEEIITKLRQRGHEKVIKNIDDKDFMHLIAES